MFWDYNKYFERPIPEKFWLPGLDEMSPVYLLEDGLSNVWIKDESVHPTGTHKDRSFRYWVSYLWSKGIRKAVIPSSGSAGRSANHFCKIAEINLTVFTKETTKTPKKDAIAFAREYAVINLRSSTDQNSIEGYKTIAFELAEQLSDAEELFIPVSSGAALLGIYNGYKMLLKEKGISMPRLYIVQTTRVHTMASMFDTDYVKEDKHDARAIVDNIGYLRDKVVRAVQESKGSGYVISNSELKESVSAYASKLNKAHGNESFLTLAALKKHQERNPQYANAKSVCLFTN